MPGKEFFPPRPASHPKVYAYSDSNPQYAGLLKVGYTEKDVERRVAQQYPTKRPDGVLPYKIVLAESAMRNDGSCFTDRDVHRVLKTKRVSGVGGEWYRCTADDVMAAIVALKTGGENIENRTQTFGMRPEQKQAVDKAALYFADIKKENKNSSPKFLWNAKMRFGKTFAAYQLAKRMGMKMVLVLTFKPAVEAAWEEDLNTHVDFEGWQFVCRDGLTFDKADKNRPIVCFGSFQDYLGTNENGGIKAKNEWVHSTNWDMIVFDEYHFGAWRENAKKLFEQEDEETAVDFDIEQYKKEEADNAFNETFLPITASYYLYLSGTPFRAINSGEFIEEQIYNWTYADEQRAKEDWGDSPDNLYAAMPRMVLMTYRMPESIRRIAQQGEFDEFDLNVFFSAKGTGKDAKFVYENEVQKWLDLIRGAHLPASMDDMKLGQDKRPPMPFSHTQLLNVLTHTLWFLPNVASCFAMANLLKQKQNTFYHGYTVNICAGSRAGIGVAALEPVRKSMEDPLTTKTITLSCGKLTTGVTIRPWTGIFMLRNLKSPETYFQAAFRVQSPWEIETGAHTKEIVKHECYVFDFALDRALRQISDYSCRLNVEESNPEKKVAEFISFLPVLAYDGSSMHQIDAQDILDIAMSGTSATLLAKRWESALLVNVDNETLKRLMANEAAMRALMSIEGFRSLNSEIETIINKSESVKKAKRGNEKLTHKEKKELSEEEKEYKTKRKQIQDKLIKFATRIPIFMYLTDYRELSLKDVITQLEPGLFKKVTGLSVTDFELLVSLNVFNGNQMNDAIYKFKRYEDSSLSYTGVNRHEGEDVGGWDTVLKRKEYEALFYNQQTTLAAPDLPEDDLPDIAEAFVGAIDDEEDEELPPETPTPKPNKQKGFTVETIKMPVIKEKPRVTSTFAAAAGAGSATGLSGFAAASPAEKSKVDVTKVIAGAAVRHKAFGEGVVLEIKGEYITVEFGKASKRFMFPGAFENGFLMVE
jgi:hypothetical protein